MTHGRPLSEEKYDDSRWIVEPFHLFDCCLEHDGVPAMILVPAEQAKDHPHKPSYILSAVSSSHYRAGTSVHNTPDCATSTFETTVPRLYDMAKLGPDVVDVAQIYENFTGGVLSSKHCQCVSTRKMERDARDCDYRSHSRVSGCLYLRRVSQVPA